MSATQGSRRKMSAVQQVWRQVDLVQLIMSKLPSPFFGRWNMQEHAFMRMRLTCRIARDASLKVTAWWFEWLKYFGKRERGKAVVLKTVPLHMQVFRQGAKKADRRWQAWYARLIIEERNLRQALKLKEDALAYCLQERDLQARMMKDLTERYNNRKRRRIDVSALVE